MDLKDIKHIFFDLDDTLWDFEKNSNHVLEKLFSKFDLEMKLNTNFQNFLLTYKKINADLWKQYSSKKIDKLFLRNNRFNNVFNIYKYNNYEESIKINDYYLHHAPHGKHLLDGCVETLNHLKQNYLLHIITNGFKEIQHIKIDGCGLRHFFTHIIISEEHQLTKPDIAIYKMAEKIANTQNNACLMIGDNFENDVEGAINAGWKAIHLSKSRNSNHNSITINNLLDLKHIL